MLSWLIYISRYSKIVFLKFYFISFLCFKMRNMCWLIFSFIHLSPFNGVLPEIYLIIFRIRIELIRREKLFLLLLFLILIGNLIKFSLIICFTDRIIILMCINLLRIRIITNLNLLESYHYSINTQRIKI